MGQNAEKIIFMARNTHKYVAKEGSRNLICRRAPHGARGLKHDAAQGLTEAARGLKPPTVHHRYSDAGRAPHGARGLKHFRDDGYSKGFESCPARGRGLKHRKGETSG